MYLSMNIKEVVNSRDKDSACFAQMESETNKVADGKTQNWQHLKMVMKFKYRSFTGGSFNSLKSPGSPLVSHCGD